MADTTITRYLKDGDQTVYPITTAEAVKMSDGTSLQSYMESVSSRLDGFIDELRQDLALMNRIIDGGS